MKRDPSWDIKATNNELGSPSIRETRAIIGLQVGNRSRNGAHGPAAVFIAARLPPGLVPGRLLRSLFNPTP